MKKAVRAAAARAAVVQAEVAGVAAAMAAVG